VFIGFECLIVSVKFEFITSSPRNPARGLPHALCGTTVADPQQILRGCPHQSPTASSPSRPSQTTPLDSTQATDRSVMSTSSVGKFRNNVSFFLRILWVHAPLIWTATISTLEQTSTCTGLLNFLLHCSTYIVAYVLSLLICSLHTKNSERRFQPKLSFGPPSLAVDTVVKMLYQLYSGLLFLDLQSPLPWSISII
jgi:hypothetical protein